MEAIDSGAIANTAAPAIAIDYWRLPKDAKLRDVVLAVRADEAHHRDVNHFAAVSARIGALLFLLEGGVHAASCRAVKLPGLIFLVPLVKSKEFPESQTTIVLVG